jgi:hypothetical protein
MTVGRMTDKMQRDVKKQTWKGKTGDALSRWLNNIRSAGAAVRAF